jgi:hypothetical protein
MERLVLAFDASCRRCREVSAAVERACGGRLEVLPLTHPDVRRWREEWFDGQAPWLPTLIEAGDETVRVWTGRRMVVPLVRGLGPRATVRVVRALGGLHAAPGESDNDQGDQGDQGMVGRKQFFRLAAGVAVAAGMVLGGRTSASAESEATRARAWVAANRGRLPQRYDEVAALPLEHRRAVFAESSPQVRTQLWLDHLDRYQATRPDLGRKRADVVARARALVPRVFSGNRNASAADLARLKDDAVATFGPAEAGALLATLGPSSGPRQQSEDCTCANLDPFCFPLLICSNSPVSCNYDDSGCGTFWTWPCDGLCHL